MALRYLDKACLFLLHFVCEKVHHMVANYCSLPQLFFYRFLQLLTLLGPVIPRMLTSRMLTLHPRMPHLPRMLTPHGLGLLKCKDTTVTMIHCGWKQHDIIYADIDMPLNI